MTAWLKNGTKGANGFGEVWQVSTRDKTTTTAICVGPVKTVNHYPQRAKPYTFGQFTQVISRKWDRDLSGPVAWEPPAAEGGRRICLARHKGGVALQGLSGR